ncbi:MAG: 4Fe-4S binding protein [Candidatus Lokiarchaeota archaeon]|nr:4Fe-4S binding protein [Candidatus Lokiarchaeota archaeon]
MEVSQEQIIINWQFKDVKKKLTYDIKKCVGCSLCMIICPVEAIDLGPIPQIVQNILDETNPKILINDNCMNCMLCAIVCPNNAFHEHITPEGIIDLDEYPSIGKFYEIDDKLCTEDKKDPICLLCKESRNMNSIKDYHKISLNCPKKCFKIKSPLKGKVHIKKPMLWKCDPQGCKACVNICPVEAFYIPEKAEDVKKFGKIACNEDDCLYCGACENACPDNLIFIERNNIEILDPKRKGGYPWVDGWINSFKNILRNNLLTGKTQIKLFINEESKKLEDTIEEQLPHINENEQKELNKINNIIQSLLKTKKIRYWIKDNRLDKIGLEIKKILDKKK